MHPWLVRLSWLALPFTAGTAIADALSGRSDRVELVTALLLWSAWAVLIVGLLVPRPAGLVGLRVAGLGLVVVLLWAAEQSATWWIAGAHGALVLLLALAPVTGEWLVNGAAYGYERRYLLRPPAPVVIGPMPLAALLLLAAIAAGPLLLAAGQWVAGAAALATGAPLAIVLARALHAMTIRWAVLVPAGLVLKDHLALRDPVLFRRSDITSVQPAPADTDGVDLTAGALGLALELRLRDEQQIDRMPGSRREAAPAAVTKVLFTPTRPAPLLADAASRKIKVATPR